MHRRRNWLNKRWERQHPNSAVGGVLENSALLGTGHVTDHVVTGGPDAYILLLRLHL
jgi:hypothetical protein